MHQCISAKTENGISDSSGEEKASHIEFLVCFMISCLQTKNVTIRAMDSLLQMRSPQRPAMPGGGTGLFCIGFREVLCWVLLLYHQTFTVYSLGQHPDIQHNACHLIHCTCILRTAPASPMLVASQPPLNLFNPDYPVLVVPIFLYIMTLLRNEYELISEYD